MIMIKFRGVFSMNMNRIMGIGLRGIGFKGFGGFRLQVVTLKGVSYLVNRDLFSLLNQSVKDFSIAI